MPHPRPDPDKVRYPGFGRMITHCLDIYRLHLPDAERDAFKQDLFAHQHLKKNPTWLSQIKMGHRLPEPEEIWVLARTLDVPVERMMHEASLYDPKKYQDVEGLIRVVEADVMHAPTERTNILRCLRRSLTSEAKRLGWTKSTSKQVADFILTRDDDPYIKALFYADTFLTWLRQEGEERKLPFAERNTSEMSAVS
jgi:hypothetical protein